MLTITKEAGKAIDNCLAHFLTDESFYRVNDNGQIVAVPRTLEDPSVPSSDVSEQELLFTIVHDRPSVHLVAQNDAALLDFCKSYHIEHDWELNVERARQEILKILSCVRWFGCCCEGVAQPASKTGRQWKMGVERDDLSKLRDQLDSERRKYKACNLAGQRSFDHNQAIINELRADCERLSEHISKERTERIAAQRTIARLGGGDV